MITPVGGIQHKGKFHVFYSETEVGPVTRKLYNELTGIQFGDIEAPEGDCKSRIIFASYQKSKTHVIQGLSSVIYRA